MRLMTVTLVAMLLAAVPSQAQQTPFRLVTESRHRELVGLIPATDDPRLEKIVRDHRLIVYTAADLPPVSQFWDGNPLAGLHHARHNISANPQRQRDGSVSGGPGQEFPWRTPFGMDQAEGWTTFKFLWLPPGQPILWWRERLPRDAQAAYRWSFPVGTVFGEVMLVQDFEAKYSRAFELRVRRKAADGKWQPNVYRPVTSREELEQAAPETVGKTRRRAWTLQNPHPTVFLRAEATEDVLPAMGAGRVRELLSRTFRSVRGKEWIPGGHAPGSEQQFSLVPKGYAGAAVAVDAKSCARCHQTTLKHPDDFGPPGRDWYGRVPGDDEAFSFSIFNPASVSTSGFSQPVGLHPGMVSAGILRRWE